MELAGASGPEVFAVVGEGEDVQIADLGSVGRGEGT